MASASVTIVGRGGPSRFGTALAHLVAMQLLPLSCLALLGGLLLVGCGGGTDAHGFAPETAGWPEQLTTSAEWPTYNGGPGPLGPRWHAPRELGCGEQVWVRTEPDRNFAPGDGPRTVYGNVLGITCVSNGISLVVVDQARYEEQNLFRGDCIAGIHVSTQGEQLGELHFATPEACEKFTNDRRSVPNTMLRARTVFRLATLKPAVTFDFVEASFVSESVPFDFSAQK